jgi:hypothetical protein
MLRIAVLSYLEHHFVISELDTLRRLFPVNISVSICLNVSDPAREASLINIIIKSIKSGQFQNFDVQLRGNCAGLTQDSLYADRQNENQDSDTSVRSYPSGRSLSYREHLAQIAASMLDCCSTNACWFLGAGDLPSISAIRASVAWGSQEKSRHSVISFDVWHRDNGPTGITTEATSIKIFQFRPSKIRKVQCISSTVYGRTVLNQIAKNRYEVWPHMAALLYSIVHEGVTHYYVPWNTSGALVNIEPSNNWINKPIDNLRELVDLCLKTHGCSAIEWSLSVNEVFLIIQDLKHSNSDVCVRFLQILNNVTIEKS